MISPDVKKSNLKKKILHEVAEYWGNVAYLALVFAAFTQYRRLVLAAHDITYRNYWVAVIEALVLAKVIMIGEALRLGRGLENKPLIYPTFYKTVVFTVFVGIFKIIEHVIAGLWHGKGITGGLVLYSEKGLQVVLAYSLVVLAAFIPFFAVKELARVLGRDKIAVLFFRGRDN